jgi:hypothetical protein
MIERTIKRHQIKKAEVNELLKKFKSFLDEKIEEQGNGIFISGSEISGAIDEEVREFKDAKHDRDVGSMEHELLDIAVAALWGHVSLNNAGMMDCL